MCKGRPHVYARIIKYKEWIDPVHRRILPQAFTLRESCAGKPQEKGVSVILLNHFPGDIWTIAKDKVPPRGEEAQGYGALTEQEIGSFALHVESRPSRNIPQHYEIFQLDITDRCKMVVQALQLAQKAKLILYRLN